MTEPQAARAGVAAGISRRTVLVGALGLGTVALVGVPRSEANPLAPQPAPVVQGKIGQTYLAAGGATVLGRPLADEVERRISHRSTYAQSFERGTVWWGSKVGKVDLPAGARVRLDTARNFRTVAGVRDLWRTDDLDGCTPLEKRIVADLGIAVMIAMNSGVDPDIPGVRNRKYVISNAGSHLEFYRGYVTRHASRTSVGRVLRRVARTDAGVLVHCAAGKDRTGWVCDLMQAVAGVDEATRDAGYLATRTYSGEHVDIAWLRAARSALVERYETIDAYLVHGCGMETADLARLRTRLAG